MNPTDLDAFLDATGAPSLAAYLEQHGRNPTHALDERTRWAAWNFRDPAFATEASFLMHHAHALKRVLDEGEVAWRRKATDHARAPTAVPADPLPGPPVAQHSASPLSEAATRILDDGVDTAIDDPTDHRGLARPTREAGGALRVGLEKTAYGDVAEADLRLSVSPAQDRPDWAPTADGPSAVVWFALGVSFAVVLLGATALCSAIIYRLAWVNV